MARVAVIDDDRAILMLVQRGLEKHDHSLAVAMTGEDGVRTVREFGPDVVVLDLMLRESNGLEVLERIQKFDRRLPVIFVTASAGSDTAIQAMQMGAYDYIAKPLDLPKLAQIVERAAETRRQMSGPIALKVGAHDWVKPNAFIGRSPSMLGVYKVIGRVARQSMPVLIRGESGTGKELVAKALYHHGDRSQQLFTEVNCAALPDSLLESELFGHEKGAFTGADQRRIGKFEQCDGGTIFLDEIGDMSPIVQAKVLRLLQEQRFERVGGNETIQTDVRIVAATNRDLETMVASGKFRSDLLYRLNGVTVFLPPLRERGEDIQHLLQYFLTEAILDFGNTEIDGVSTAALDILLGYSWPGNIRELRSVIRQSVLNASGSVITPEFLPTDVLRHAGMLQPSTDNSTARTKTSQIDLEGFVDDRLQSGTTDLYAETIGLVERFLITQVLQETNGNQSRAAEILGVTRRKIRDRVAAFNINLRTSVQATQPDANTSPE